MCFKFKAIYALQVLLQPSLSLHTVCHSLTADSIPSITEDTAREAFVQFASSKCCYSAAPAKDGVITKMDAFNTYRVRGGLINVCVC